MDTVSLKGHRTTVKLGRYNRGSSMAGGRLYGYNLTCSCGWTARWNGPKREATSYAKEHIRFDTKNGTYGKTES